MKENSDQSLQKQFISIVRQGRIEWSAHALRRMLERGIRRAEVKNVICTGEMIESYPSDSPYPSFLLFGIHPKKPLHVVISIDTAQHQLFLITAYRPDEKHFQPDLKTRRK